MPATPILPTDAEIDAIVVRPGSLLYRRFGDARLFLASGYALLLQVAHPTVGSGVRDHSNFLEDPWGRLLRTLDYLNMLIYGGDEAAAVGRRLRDLHKPIKGQNPDGSHYHALEPEAYAWVHATLLEGALAAHRRFVGRLRAAEEEQFLAEFMPLGRLLGVRDRDMPASMAAFHRYYDEMVRTRLERTSSVEDVIGAFGAAPPPPSFPPQMQALWKLLRVPPAQVLRISSFGLMPSHLRAKLDIPWSAANEAELRALGVAARSVTPLMPQRLRQTGPAYLRWRREEIARGPLGPGEPGVDPSAVAA